MLNRKLSHFVVILFVLGLFVNPASAQDKEKEIRTLLQQRDREIKNVIGNKKTLTDTERETLKDLINGDIDFEQMGKVALGTHWNSLTATQQKEFVDVFSEIVRTQSLADLDIYRTKVEYGKITVQGNEARVSTSVTYKEVPTRVDYVLGFRNNAWRVDDIVLDDVSTTEGYARSFQSVIRKKGFDSLMASLHKKLDRIASSK